MIAAVERIGAIWNMVWPSLTGCTPRRLTGKPRDNEYLLRLAYPFAKGTRLPGTSLSQARDSAVVAELVDAQR